MTNLIPEVCKLLGVEVGERFKLRDGDSESINKYYIDADGMVCKVLYEETCHAIARGLTLTDLLRRHTDIVKLPWKPKEGDIYYTVWFDGWELFTVEHRWHDKNIDGLALFKAGFVFRTREEAEAALPKVAEELGVEYEI